MEIADNGSSAQEATTNTGKPSIDRKRSNIARALIVFNVYGVTLSYSPYLEYYYNTGTYGTISTLQASAVIAVQVCCMFSIVVPAAWVYQRGGWRLMLWIGTTTTCICHVLPRFCKDWWQLLLVRGFGHGLSLGSLGVVGTLCLGTHYRNNVPLVSLIGSSAGLLGALVYTVVAYIFLSNFQHSTACYANFGIATGTLLLAAMLLKQDSTYAKLRIGNDITRPLAPLKQMYTLIFIIGYWCLFSGVFVYPSYMVLLIASPPGPVFPRVPTRHLMFTYIIGIPSAIVSSSSWFRSRLGPVNTFICASVLAGACLVNPAWMPWAIVSLPSALVYGICLGAILALHIKVLYTILLNVHVGQSLGHIHVALVLAGAGLAALAGLILTAALVQYTAWGFSRAMTIAGVLMIAGAGLMAWARFVSTGRRFFVVI